jgi:T4 superinfection immunity protein
MFHFLFFVLLYFLPAILGRDKSDATGIFLLNLLLGWTIIGWVAVLIWAISSDRTIHVRYAPAGPGRFCCQCGSVAHPGAHFCSACGRTV